MFQTRNTNILIPINFHISFNNLGLTLLCAAQTPFIIANTGQDPIMKGDVTVIQHLNKILQ
jgi:bacterioferritin